MNILLIRTKKGQRYAAHLQSYLGHLGVTCHIAERSEVAKVIRTFSLTPKNTFIHSRSAGLKLLEILKRLEKKGFKIVNSPKTLYTTFNKYKAHQHAEKNGLPVAATFKVLKSNFKKIKKLLAEYGAVVVKPIFSQGQGIYCSKLDVKMSEQELREKIKKVPGIMIQVQQFIDYKKLIRVIVINYKALEKAVTYDTPSENWKCSVCLNPKIKKYVNPPRELLRLAEKTAQKFKAQINYIDFFEDQKGRYVLNEINTACSLFIHEEVTGYPIYKDICLFLGRAKPEREDE